MPNSNRTIIKRHQVGADITAPMFPAGHILSIDLMDVLPQRESQLFGVVMNGELRIQWVSFPEASLILEARTSLQDPAMPVITQSPDDFRVVGRLVQRHGLHY